MLGLKRSAIEIERHESERLPAIAERFFPFGSSSLGHFGLTAGLIASCPPRAGGGTVKLSSREVEAADFIHSRGEPEESFRSKYAAQILL